KPVGKLVGKRRGEESPPAAGLTLVIGGLEAVEDADAARELGLLFLAFRLFRKCPLARQKRGEQKHSFGRKPHPIPPEPAASWPSRRWSPGQKQRPCPTLTYPSSSVESAV